MPAGCTSPRPRTGSTIRRRQTRGTVFRRTLKQRAECWPRVPDARWGVRSQRWWNPRSCIVSVEERAAWEGLRKWTRSPQRSRKAPQRDEGAGSISCTNLSCPPFRTFTFTRNGGLLSCTPRDGYPRCPLCLRFVLFVVKQIPTGDEHLAWHRERYRGLGVLRRACTTRRMR